MLIDATAALRKMMQEESFCTVERQFGAGSRLCGYILQIGADVVAIEKFHDFYSEGISLVRIEDVREVNSDEQDDLFNTVISTERLRMRHTIPYAALTGFDSVLRWAHESGNLVSVERETHIGENSDFWLGRIEASTDQSISLREMDPAGRWGPKTDLLVSSLTHIEILTPYLQYYAKYAERARR